MTPPDITHRWTWTGGRTLPDWLAHHHHWHADRPVIHTSDGPRHLHHGWLVALWSDGAITVGSNTVADRVYGPNGIAGRLQRAEARARELERHLREADAENLELAAHNDRTCEAVQRRDAAEAAVARVRALHQPAECVNVRCKLKQWCIGCDPDGIEGCDENPWPCPTITALAQTGPLTRAEEARLAQSGVDTPGCDCGHDGMGVSWHRDDCLWRRGVVDCPGRPAPA